jgi:hypothetical protein
VARRPRPDVAAGDLLDGRYRLIRRAESSEASDTQRWAGLDELLERPVDIRLAPSAMTTSLVDILAGATDSRWLRLLDVGTAKGQSWVVVEDPCRPTLVERLATGPLAEPEAIEVALAAIAAVSAAPPHVVVADALTPDRVYLDVDGMRIDGTDALQPTPHTAAQLDLVTAVARVLFACLTARWPTARSTGGLEAAGAVVSPRHLNREVTRGTDRLVAAALGGQVSDLAAFAALLTDRARRLAAVGTPAAGVVTARRLAVRILPPLTIALMGLLAWTIGSDLGAIPAPDRIAPLAHPTPPAAGHRLAWTSSPVVRSFDPGGDGQEDPAGTGAAVDSSPVSAWQTDRYATAEFGGLKTGVGLLLDLGRPRLIGSARLELTSPGGRIQIRAGNTLPSSAGLLKTIAAVTPHRRVLRPTIRRPVRARYWLVWITSLPRGNSSSGGGYRDGIADLKLYLAAGGTHP